MKTNFIVAPNDRLARMIRSELRHEFYFDKEPRILTPDNWDRARFMGLIGLNVFVPMSFRDWLSLNEWPKFVKNVRMEYEARSRGDQAMYNKWIEVYLP